MLQNNDNAGARKKIQNYSYALNSKIGKGYSSQVFKGRNDITNQQVAIKVIDMRLLKGDVHKALLASEIQVLKTFKKTQNIIEVFDILTTKNNTYIITELCEGGDLSKQIAESHGFTETKALEYLRQIISGYQEISSNRIIHRDLKPANILLQDNKIKIADFGFAMRDEDSRKYSSYNVGSPIYMPPQALNENKYSSKSDIWALGVIFYELLTGKTPWKAKTQKQLGKQLLTIPIQNLIPKNLTKISIQFLKKTLKVNIDSRMGPEELNNFLEKLNPSREESHPKIQNHQQRNEKVLRVNEPSIKYITEKNQITKRNQSSLSKHTIKSANNLKKLGLASTNNNLSSNSTKKNMEEKNMSLPKTSSTINNQLTLKGIEGQINRKQISKQFLSQIHFCRFIYKLLQRIRNNFDELMNQNLKSQMKGLIFRKLSDVKKLKNLETAKTSEYRKTADFNKISQIADQYEEKYEKDLGTDVVWTNWNFFEQILSTNIKQLFEEVQRQKNIKLNQERVIILDYLITLKQLCTLQSKQNLEIFHLKSKIQAIVEGSPAKNITWEHVRAITTKMQAIKLL